ncbi:MAG: hypothetical protein ACRDG3_07635 [Tepidiformaceae bacterium]
MATRHGVVVVHGQVSGQVLGDELAVVANAIADALENAEGRVERAFAVEGGHAAGTLTVTRPGDSVPSDEFVFSEAFWANSLPTAPAETVAKWMLVLGPKEAWRVVRGFWGNLANDRIDDGKTSGYPQRAWLRVAFALELAPITALIAVIVVLRVVIAPLLYALYSMTSVTRTNTLAVVSPVTGFLHKLDPFLSDVMGDSWRFVEDGMWSANIRDAVEGPLVAFYADAEIADITIIAHSAGCGVSYDALAEGGVVAAAAAEHPKRLTLVTCGSAVNRFYWLSKESDTSPYTQRLSRERIAPAITGMPKAPAPSPAPAETEAAQKTLQARFYWLDIYARMDLVPAGPPLAEVLEMARIDPCQLKRRPVINEDDLLRDHFGYFRNNDLVAPRLIRAIYGGEYPWTGTTRYNSTQVTKDRILHRTRGVALLQLVRVVLFASIIAWLVLFIANDSFRAWFERDAGGPLNLDIGPVSNFVTGALGLIAPISVAYFVYVWFRGWFFDTL